MQQKRAAAGDRAILIDLGDDVDAATLHRAAAATRANANVLACITGHSSLYVIFRSAPVPLDLGAPGAELRVATRIHRVEVSFADAYATDLPELLARIGITRDAFLARVATLTLTARYLGFRGGFAYLEGWPEEWSMPRRPTSRPRVARGSFAVAGAMAGFYPLDSPGGWNLLGRTAADVAHAFAPGDEITIVPTLDSLPESAVDRRAAPQPQICGVEIEGRFVTIVGAADYTRLDRGLPPGGPFDEPAARSANALVGNAHDAPLLECAMLGPRVRFREPRIVAWCGAESDLPNAPFVAREVNVGRIRNGLRGYLAISSAADAQRASLATSPLARSERNVIRVMRGPHRSAIGTVECEVTPHLDRVGIRLRPLAPLGVEAPADLRSCGMQFGSIQLHPDGSLVAMGPDHPITGGYLQPLTVLWEERWKLAQLVPGERVTLVAMDQSPYT